MRYRVIAAVVAAIALGVVVATTASASTKSHTLVVWLQGDAQSGWPNVVANANTAFKNANPGWNVDVQYQSWSTHLQNFDATIAGNNVPDVIEMGNTEMTKYMAAGAFANITAHKGTFANSSHWLAGLAKPSTDNGKLMGVPYYAGSRLVAYRTDLFKKAGIKTVPNSLATFQTDLGKVATKSGSHPSGFKPFYMGGTDWYSALSFVFDYGGNIAALVKGKWVGKLESANSIAGLTAYKKFFLAYSPHSAATLNENSPPPYTVFSDSKAAAIFGPGWFTCCTGAGLKSVTAQFVMPSHVAGKAMPGFLGGSDLAVPKQGGQQAQARQWIGFFTNTSNEKALQAKGNIPNATNLLDNSINDKAAKSSWFVPTAKHWVDVENANTLRVMLSDILTGHKTVKAAAHSADAAIAHTLNQP